MELLHSLWLDRIVQLFDDNLVKISEIYGNGKFGRFHVVLKLEFYVKNW